MKTVPQNQKRTRIQFWSTAQLKSDVKYEAKMQDISQGQFINDAIKYYRDVVHHNYDTPSILVQRMNELIQIEKYRSHADLQSRHEVARVLNRFMSMNSGRINDYLHHDE